MVARTHIGPDGRTYVGVTSAMRLVKQLLGEPEDQYGPPAMAKIHALEGEGCHRTCLDWLAHTFHLLPEFNPIAHPVDHGDPARWHAVMAAALQSFQQFMKEHEVEPLGIEQEAYSPAYGLVGHVDLPCTLRWKGRRVKAVCDLKFTRAVLPSHVLQVRCYAKLEGLKDAQIGLLFHCPRLGEQSWRALPVDLTVGQDDVAAVSNAARLYLWAEGKAHG